MTARRRLSVTVVALAAMLAAPPPVAADTPDAPPTIDISGRGVSITDHVGHTITVELPQPPRRDRERTRGSADAGYTLHTGAGGGWASALIEITGPEAPHRYAFRLRMPPGWSLRAAGDGSIIIEDPHGDRVGTIAPPWAVDAAGNEVPTSYALEGHRLIQMVDHREAEYPVIADPSVTLGRNVYLWVRGYEIGWWGSASAAFLSTYVCAAYGSLHPVLCAIGAVGAWWLITAFNEVFAGDHCRYVIAVRYWGWPNYMERLRRYGCTYRKSEIPG